MARCVCVLDWIGELWGEGDLSIDAQDPIDPHRTHTFRLAALSTGTGGGAIARDERYRAFVSQVLLPPAALEALGREVRCG